MATSTVDLTMTADRFIDLRGHRLGELVQALTGCSATQAELAVGDLAPRATVSETEALDVVATAMVRLRGGGVVPAADRAPARTGEPTLIG